eukprot:jgi/Bigna1/130166/aug1.10_g4874
MMKSGCFDDGKVRWVLMPEGTGRELDVTSARCQPVHAVPKRQAEDADQEEWSIQDSSSTGGDNNARDLEKKRETMGM